MALLLALVWVRLAAVDVALTEAAIGSGVTGALLIGAAARLRRSTRAALPEQRPALVTRTAAAALCAMIAASLAAAVLMLPSPAPTLAAAMRRRISARPGSATRSPPC